MSLKVKKKYNEAKWIHSYCRARGIFSLDREALKLMNAKIQAPHNTIDELFPDIRTVRVTTRILDWLTRSLPEAGYIADAQTKLTEDPEYRQRIYGRLVNEVRPYIEKTRKYKF